MAANNLIYLFIWMEYKYVFNFLAGVCAKADSHLLHTKASFPNRWTQFARERERKIEKPSLTTSNTTIAGPALNSNHGEKQKVF